MSSYLGFQPTKSQDYYFVSYNNEDADRVGTITQKMAAAGVNLWYDHGIEYGDNWETVITERIQNAQAIVLFFTEGILQKSNSYVQKEYKIATEFFGKRVYVVLLDQISKDEVPMEKVAWWMSINEKQCITGYEYTDTARLARDVIGALHGEQRQTPVPPVHPPKKEKKKPRRGCLTALLITLAALLLIVGLAVGGIYFVSSSFDSDALGFTDFWNELFNSESRQEPADTDDPWQETQREEKESDDVIYFPIFSDRETDEPTDPPPENPTYTVTTYSNITGDYEGDAPSDVFMQPQHQQFEAGETVNLTVNVPEGYNFLGWYRDDRCVETHVTYIFTMQEHDVELQARFSVYTLHTSTNDKYAGTYTAYSGQRFAIGQEITLRATPNEGYNFVGWYISGSDTLLSNQPTYTFTMGERDMYLEARFSSFTLTTSGYTYEGMAGSFTEYNYKQISIGTPVTLTATTQNGYNFEGWFRDGICVSTELTYSFDMPDQDVYVTAQYSKYTLTVTAENFEGTAGTVTKYKDEIIAAGEIVTLQASVNDGYNFDGWYIRGVRVSKNLTYEYLMKKEDISIEARYSYYTVSTSGYTFEGMAGGFTEYREKKMSVGKQVTLTATVNEGYIFTGWYKSGVCVSESLTYTFEMPEESVYLEAMYQEDYTS